MAGLEGRHALLLTGNPSEEDLCREFLLTPEFKKETLLKFAGATASKEVLARSLAASVASNVANAEQLVLAFCKQPRTWLTFQRGKPTVGPSGLGSARSLLTKFGSGGWYGPFAETADTHWLVYSHIAQHFVETSREGNRVNSQAFPARWHVVAQVRQDSFALHWNNFSFCEDSDDVEAESFRQFPYWRFVPDILAGLGKLYGVEDIVEADMHNFILHTLHDRYPQSASGNWKHLKVRALSDGVSFNSSGREEAGNVVAGVQKLTRSLAIAALRHLGIAEESATIQQLDEALVRQILHEWGVKSYNFSVEATHGKFRAHCYFGALDESDTPDRFPHFKCYVTLGGSLSALTFLLTELAA